MCLGDGELGVMWAMFVLQMLHASQCTANVVHLLKALHIIFVVTWFAGLFYMFRLFGLSPRGARPTPRIVRDALIAQFRIMERRLWFAITWPSSILAITFGVGSAHHILLLSRSRGFTSCSGFVALLLVYQATGHRIWATLRHADAPWSSTTYRLSTKCPLSFSLPRSLVVQGHLCRGWAAFADLGVSSH